MLAELPRPRVRVVREVLDLGEPVVGADPVREIVVRGQIVHPVRALVRLERVGDLDHHNVDTLVLRNLEHVANLEHLPKVEVDDVGVVANGEGAVLLVRAEEVLVALVHLRVVEDVVRGKVLHLFEVLKVPTHRGVHDPARAVLLDDASEVLVAHNGQAALPIRHQLLQVPDGPPVVDETVGPACHRPKVVHVAHLENDAVALQSVETSPLNKVPFAEIDQAGTVGKIVGVEHLHHLLTLLDVLVFGALLAEPPDELVGIGHQTLVALETGLREKLRERLDVVLVVERIHLFENVAHSGVADRERLARVAEHAHEAIHVVQVQLPVEGESRSRGERRRCHHLQVVEDLPALRPQLNRERLPAVGAVHHRIERLLARVPLGADLGVILPKLLASALEVSVEARDVIAKHGQLVRVGHSALVEDVKLLTDGEVRDHVRGEGASVEVGLHHRLHVPKHAGCDDQQVLAVDVASEPLEEVRPVLFFRVEKGLRLVVERDDALHVKIQLDPAHVRRSVELLEAAAPIAKDVFPDAVELEVQRTNRLRREPDLAAVSAHREFQDLARSHRGGRSNPPHRRHAEKNKKFRG